MVLLSGAILAIFGIGNDRSGRLVRLLALLLWFLYPTALPLAVCVIGGAKG